MTHPVSPPRLLMLDPRQVELDPQGTRSQIGDLQGLATSIAADGLLQPIGVRPASDGQFRVVYGGRRLAAAVRLGLAEVPCLVLAEGGDPLVQQILENVQRRDLGDMEKARAFARLGERITTESPGLRGGALREEIGRRLGVSGRTVARYLSLLELSAEVQNLIDEGELTVTQAQHLLAVEPEARQVALAREAVERGLSAAQISLASARLAGHSGLAVEAVVGALDTPSHQPAAPAAPQVTPRDRRDADPGTDEGAAEEAEFWPEEAGEAESGLAVGATPLTQDRARVLRIRSLDSFADEVARLTRCVQDGDLARLVRDDPQGAVKLELAVRQIGFLARAVADLRTPTPEGS